MESTLGVSLEAPSAWRLRRRAASNRALRISTCSSDSTQSLGQGLPVKKCWPSRESIMEIVLRSPPDFPLELPVGKYLEESLMGLRGSPHDTQAREAGGKLSQFVDCFFTIVSRRTMAVQTACANLFWIAVGLLFGRFVVPQVLASVRKQLAHQLHLFHLQACEQTSENVETRDWVLSALPVVLAQAIYRLLCDAFPEDRPQLVGKGSNVLDKLNQLVHFEISGFQIQLDRTRKERRRFFMKRIINSPHMNAYELESCQKRQELLESQNSSLHDMPLSFGALDRPPMDDTQLEHLMHKHVVQAPGTPMSPKPSPAKKGNMLDLESVSQLGVERYDGLSERGDELLQRHLQALATCLGETEPVVEDLEANPTIYVPPTPGSEISPKRFEFWVEDGDADDAPKQQPSSPKSFEKAGKPSTPKAKTVRMEAAAGNKQRAKEQQQQAKARTEMLLAKISEPLCAELCQRRIQTSWVSPAMSRLTPGADDRNLLRKGPCETFHVNMCEAPSLASRPGSAPMKKPGIAEEHARPSSQAQAHRPHYAMPTASVAHSAGHPGGHQSRDHSARPDRRKGETLVLEMQTLSHKTMMQRLDAQTRYFREQAFGNYMKEYDIFTGEKKAGVNVSRLQKDEKAYVREMDKMVGGSALTVNPFSKSQKGRMKQVSG